MTKQVDQPNHDFVEAIARGLEVINSFGASAPVQTVRQAAERTGLPRPTVRRLLLTLEQLGYVRSVGNGYELTAQILDLGAECIGVRDRWDLAEPHLARLVAHTHESSSIGVLDGADVLIMARVAVPKVISIAIRIGSRLPAGVTSLGRVLLAELPPERLDATLAMRSQSGVLPRVAPTVAEIKDSLGPIRQRGWAVSDQMLAAGMRSIAVPIRDGAGGALAALNVTVHASETPVDRLLNDHLPHVLDAAKAIEREWANLELLPTVELIVAH